MVLCKNCKICLGEELLVQTSDDYDQIFVCPNCGCSGYEEYQDQIESPINSRYILDILDNCV